MTDKKDTPPPGKPPKRNLEAGRQAKRDTIRYAAYRCFSEHGYYNTTVDAICALADISKGSFYWHFESKQAAFLEILDAWADDVEAEMTAQFAPLTERSRNRYRVFGTALLREARRSGAIMPLWLQFISEAQRDAHVREELVHFHGRIRRLAADVALRLLPGPISAAEAESIGTTVFASFLGLVSLALVDPKFDLQAAVENTLLMMIRGLERKDERGQPLGPPTPELGPPRAVVPVATSLDATNESPVDPKPSQEE